MNYFIVLGVVISIATAGNCGVYSNGCEHLSGFSWSSISEYKVSCNFDGYVKKIEKTIDFYPDNKCEETSFITNTYSYSLAKKGDGNKDESNYDVTLTKATFESSDLETLSNRKVSCTPAIKEGKAYSLKDVTCKALMINLWKSYSDRLDKTYEGKVVFGGTEDERTMYFLADSLVNYKKVSNFLGCWEWWSITLLIIGIILVIGIIVYVTIILTNKKSKMPKKK